MEETDKLLFGVQMRYAPLAFPRGEGAPQGRMRNGDICNSESTQIVQSKSEHGAFLRTAVE